MLAPKAAAAADDYITYKEPAVAAYKKYGGGAADSRLPAMFQDYHKSPPTGVSGNVILYYDTSNNQAVYCSDITNTVIGSQPTASITPHSSFAPQNRQNLLRYVLYHGQKSCTPLGGSMAGGEAVELQIATQIAVWMIAEGVYPGDALASYYESLPDAFAPTSAIAEKLKALMAGAIAYAANPQSGLDAESFIYPSFASLDEGTAPEYSMTPDGLSHSCELTDTAGALAADWMREVGTTPVGGQTKYYLSVKDSGGLSIDVGMSGGVRSNTMTITGDPGELGTLVQLESRVMPSSAQIQYLHTPGQNYQDMVRFARVASSSESRLLYFRVTRGAAQADEDTIVISKRFSDYNSSLNAIFTLKDNLGNPVDLSYPGVQVTPGYCVLDGGSGGRIALRHAQSATISGLPFSGSPYQLEEAQLPGYTVPQIVIRAGSATSSGYVLSFDLTDSSPGCNVHFENIAEGVTPEPGTAKLIVSKTFVGEPAGGGSQTMAVISISKGGQPVDLAAAGVSVRKASSTGSFLFGAQTGELWLSTAAVLVIEGLDYGEYLVEETMLIGAQLSDYDTKLAIDDGDWQVSRAGSLSLANTGSTQGRVDFLNTWLSDGPSLPGGGTDVPGGSGNGSDGRGEGTARIPGTGTSLSLVSLLLPLAMLLIGIVTVIVTLRFLPATTHPQKKASIESVPRSTDAEEGRSEDATRQI